MSGLKYKFLVNVIGALAGITIALITVPLYISHIGETRYGLLSLVWVMLGFMGFMDFGLSRATANALAKIKETDSADRSIIFASSLTINALLGSIGGLLIYFFGGYVLLNSRGLSNELVVELQYIMPYLAPMLPLALMAGVGIGALEARERFAAANMLQITTNGLNQILPLIAAIWIAPTLTVVIPTILLIRALGTACVLIIAIRSERMHFSFRLDFVRVRELLGYGVWITITNLINPLVTSIDQFVISSMIGASHVARYSVPKTIASRLQILNSSLARTLFPRFSSLSGDEAKLLAAHSIVALAYIPAMLFAPALVVVHHFFHLWVGSIAEYAVPVARIIFIGAWINGLAFIPFALLQGQGRPDKVAKLHMAEVLPYLIALWYCVQSMGLSGAALAWSLRVTADAFILAWFTHIPFAVLIRIIPAFTAVGFGLYLGTQITEFSLPAAFCIGSLLSLAILLLGIAMEPRIKTVLIALLNKLRIKKTA